VIACLRDAGIEVVEEHVGVWDDVRDGWSAGLRLAGRLGLAELRLLARRIGDSDVVVVGYPGHFDLLAARRAAHGVPIVFNPLVSLADTLVADRRRFRAGSAAARALELVDRRALAASDLVVVDTETHARYFAGLTDTPIEVCFVGAEERVFGAGWQPKEPFTALFVGKLIPLHGIETVLAAARLTPEIRFRIVGSGQLEHLLDDVPANVERVAWVPYEQLPSALHAAGCALGIFGTSDKASRVIPNKAFQAIACGTPLVTGDTPAARELLVDGESALLVPPGDPAALAAAIRRLAGDRQLAGRLSAAGRATFEQRASEAVLGARWRELLQRLVD